ncbi:MAG: alpha/beta fold hydrolase [Planctomycetota bacterium]|jgi:pimeloyl-ACP methyl ester carboxylesterase
MPRPTTYRLPGLLVTEHRVQVPLDHAKVSGPEIEIFARELCAPEHEGRDLPMLVFFQGGPGFEAPRPQERGGWIKRALNEYRVLLLDQRGTGRSTRVGGRVLAEQGDAAAQADFLALFRADAIVEDAECLRRALLDKRTPWSILGQSFGGFCALRYLSAHPEGLREVFITGGLPTIGNRVDEVYRATYRLVHARNERFYSQFPDLVERATSLRDRLARGDVRLPSGDPLSPARLRALGVCLGMSDGAGTLRYLLESYEPRQHADPDVTCLRALENGLHFDTNPLYAAVHESCWADGGATNWSAERVRSDFERFADDADGPPWFTAEMIYPGMFRELGALRPFADAAQRLAEREWPRLYDPQRLAHNEVPAAAAIYAHDAYVPRAFSEDTAAQVRGLRAWLTSEYEHNGLRADGERVLGRLIDLARGEI